MNRPAWQLACTLLDERRVFRALWMLPAALLLAWMPAAYAATYSTPKQT